jgi:ankyrin repeat protein
MRILSVICCVAIASLAWSQSVMPKSLAWDLDTGTGKKALAQLKANPKLVHSREKESTRQTPLHIAAARGHVEVVKWLVSHGADVNARCYNEFTPLLLAANAPIAEVLLKAGAKSSVRSSFGATPLQYAAMEAWNGDKSRRGAAEAMLRFGVKLDLISAICLGRSQDVQRILAADPKQTLKGDVGGRTPLHFAARTGDVAIARALLKAGAAIDAGSEPMMNFGRGRFTPLCDAVWAGKHKMIEFLCEQGADPNLMGDQLTRALQDSTPAIKAILRKYSRG